MSRTNAQRRLYGTFECLFKNTNVVRVNIPLQGTKICPKYLLLMQMIQDGNQIVYLGSINLTQSYLFLPR